MLEVQRDGPRAFLWAGLAAASGADPGKGCLSWELLGSADPPDGWRAYDKSWDGGSCLALAFSGSTAYAATHRAGVLWLDASRRDASWSRPGVDSGLPLREPSASSSPCTPWRRRPGAGCCWPEARGGVYRQHETRGPVRPLLDAGVHREGDAAAHLAPVSGSARARGGDRR